MTYPSASWLCLVIIVFVLLVTVNADEKDCLTVELNGRMGNLMFEHASVVGICVARKLDYKTCAHLSNTGWNTWDLPIKDFISVFNLPVESTKTCQIVRRRDYREKSFTYDPHFQKLEFGTTIHGWLQSWKYFHPHAEQIIRKLYTVPEFQAHTAENYMLNIRNHIPHDHKIIGVHVRLGDKLNNPQNENFYDKWSLSENYYRKAITLLTRRHKKHALVFFSGGGETKDHLSRDRHWTKEKFGNLSNYTFFDHSDDHFVAFKALSLCDSIVVAHSTFSWWAAYLSETLEIVAPYHLFSPTAEVTEGYSADDFYPPWWSLISQNSTEDRIVGPNPLVGAVGDT